MNEQEFQNLYAALIYLSGPGGATAWFIAVSSFFTNMRERGAFVKWQPWQMQVLVMAVSLAVPAIALGVVLYVPREVVESLQPWWAFIGAVSIAYLVQQGFYFFNKPGKDAG